MTKLKSNNNVAYLFMAFFLAFSSYIYAKNINSDEYSACILNENSIFCKNKIQLKLLDVIGYENTKITNDKALNNLKVRYTANSHPHFYDISYRYIHKKWFLSEVERVTYSTNKEKIDTVIRCKATVNKNINKIDEMFFVNDVDDLFKCKEEVKTVASAKSLEPSLCEGGILKVKRINGTSVIMCDCQCTNEENTFYIKPNSLKVTYKIEASRLVSQKTISQSSSKNFCDDKEFSEKHDPNSLVFITKAPNQNGDVCFEVSSNGLNKNGLFERGKSDSTEVFEFNNFQKQPILIKKAYLYNNTDTVVVDNLKSDFNKFLQTQALQIFKPIKTKMYLIKGDKVTLLDEQTDNTGQKWYFINYKGKKDLNMWIKAEAVDIKTPQQVEPTKPKKPAPAPQTKVETPKPAVAKTEPEPSTPKETEATIAKEEATKTKSGSSSFPLLVSLLGLLAWRAST